MSKPTRDGSYIGETESNHETVWIWMGYSWEDANKSEPDAGWASRDRDDLDERGLA